MIAWLAGGLLVRSQIAATLAGFAALFLLYRRSLPELVRFALGHPAVIAAALVTYGFVFGMLGTGNGIQYLFWHDRWLARISASVGASLLLADLGVIAYYASPRLVEALIGPPTEDGSPISVGRSARRLRRFLMVGGAPLLLLLVAPALFPAAFPGVPRPADSRSAFASWAINLVCWSFGVAGGVAILLALLEVSPIIHRFFSKFGTEKVVDVRVSVATFYAAFVVFYVLIAWPFDALVSPAFAICALLGLLSMSNAFVAFYSVHINPRFGRWAVPPSAILAVALVVWFGLANRDPYKLRFPEMADYYPGGASGPVNLPKAVAEQYDQDRGPQPVPPGQAVLVDDATALKNWRKFAAASDTARNRTGKPKLVVLAVSGGASRSAYWVGAVLERIEAEIGGFGNHVRVITGASGGMVGASYYLRQRMDLLKIPAGEGIPPLTRTNPDGDTILTGSIPVDSITPVARYIALREPWNAIKPWVSANDRGIVLEDDWGPIGLSLQRLRGEEEQGRLPSIIVSPMIIEDGRRLLISNLDLWPICGTEGSQITGDDDGGSPHFYSLTAFEFFRLFPKAKEFRLSTAIRMNASFPYVSPAVSLPTTPPRRVVDAGYYDNYGIQVAAAWISKNVDELIENTSGVVLVQIRDSVSQLDRLGVNDAPEGFLAAASRSFQFFSSPLDGARSARSSSGSFRNDQDVEA